VEYREGYPFLRGGEVGGGGFAMESMPLLVQNWRRHLPLCPPLPAPLSVTIPIAFV